MSLTALLSLAALLAAALWAMLLAFRAGGRSARLLAVLVMLIALAHFAAIAIDIDLPLGIGAV